METRRPGVRITNTWRWMTDATSREQELWYRIISRQGSKAPSSANYFPLPWRLIAGARRRLDRVCRDRRLRRELLCRERKESQKLFADYEMPTQHSITPILLYAVAAVLLAALLTVTPLHAQSATKITFPYSPTNSSSLHWMVAKEAKIFDKYALDVDLVFMGASSLILQSMLSGSANLAGFAGPAIVSNVLRGGDVINVAATTPFTISLMARPAIEKVEELRGKKIGISRLGAVPHFAIQLIRERFDIKDAVILQMGGRPEGAAALRRGAIDAPVLSLPHTHLLQKEGFREIFSHSDYNKQHQVFVRRHRVPPLLCE